MPVLPKCLHFSCGPCALCLPQKAKTPVREAPGVCCGNGLRAWLWLLKKPACLPVHGPASGSRSSSAGMNRIKFVGFACHCFHSGSHLSAFAHPGAAASIGADGCGGTQGLPALRIKHQKGLSGALQAPEQLFILIIRPLTPRWPRQSQPACAARTSGSCQCWSWAARQTQWRVAPCSRPGAACSGQ